MVFTQCALASLRILGDPLTRVSRPHILATIKRLNSKKHKGKVMICEISTESDLRFIYSSLIVGKLLNDSSHIDEDLAIEEILSCWNHQEGAFGLKEGAESHGGATFVAVAALSMLKSIDRIPNRTALIHWLVHR